MAHDRGAAEAVRYVLLGVLLAGPSHGYDLSRHFGPASALGDIVKVSMSHLYALLTRLERDGLICGEQQSVGARPQRRVYQLTEAGKEAVSIWIDEPVAHPRDMRIDFPLKLYVARFLDPARAAALAERQRTVFLAYIARLEAEKKSAATEDDRAFIELMRAARIGRAQAALDWLNSEVVKILPRAIDAPRPVP